MNDSVRNLVLVVYAAVLGWVANSWWREEKDRIAWRAAEKAREHLQFEADMRAQPAAAESSSSS